MDSTISQNKDSAPLRRSSRQSVGKVLKFEATVRGPLKRGKKRSEDRFATKTVNGSRDVENGLEDEESPSKKSRLDTERACGDSNNENKMDYQEAAEEEEEMEDQKLEIGKELSYERKQLKISKDELGELNLSPFVVLGERCPTIPLRENYDQLKPQRESKAPASPTKTNVHTKPLEIRRDVKVTSMADYQKKMDAIARSKDTTTVNRRIPSMVPTPEKTYPTRRVKNIPAPKSSVDPKKQEKTKKSAVTKGSSGNSRRGFLWNIWGLLFLLLLSSATLLAYKIVPFLQKTADGVVPPSGGSIPEKLGDFLSLLEAHFPRQRAELWRMSKIHLEKHLKTAQPTEPVSLILAAGLRAERTLHCLAQGLASAYSSALNASVLLLDGAAKAGQDSDEVKLDIDNRLKAAFGGDTPVAVIHRFDELPPGSTLIFYRYCDHENAAYKKVFLLFTVLLPEDEIGDQLSLKEVEEMVQEHVESKLVRSTNAATFNEMDIDKFGGLWSRISHLILPVVSELKSEPDKCPHNKPDFLKSYSNHIGPS
ncbi:unnamed protein product [Menidia menidia]|uniref:(Atlantic silverside) hypothetical protein n=1 Tax=Menidia menidia TaxID=238744 RepID=A0A8S4A804_9TELE|nr:unnamed protein product [Menidia menidia]